MKCVIFIGVCLLALQARSENVCKEKSTTTFSTVNGKRINACRGDLIFEDNFDFLDHYKWQHENTLGGGGNWEFQWYSNNRTTSYTEGGILHIKPSLLEDAMGDGIYSATLDINGGSPADECTNPAFYGCMRTGSPDNPLNPIKSARLRTLGHFSFTYGTVQVRAKMPAGDWLWPAIWMMPAQNAYSGWPASGEIDICESRGNRDLSINGAQIGTQQMGSTMHWGPDYFTNRYEYTHWEQNNPAGYNSDFHVYEVEWTPDQVTFRVDGADLGTISPPAGGFWELGNLAETGYENPWRHGTKMAPFDQEFYIILNLAVGGVNYFPDNAVNGNGAKPWNNNSPTAAGDFYKGKGAWLPTWNMGTDDSHLQVDYVRVYAL